MGVAERADRRAHRPVGLGRSRSSRPRRSCWTSRSATREHRAHGRALRELPARLRPHVKAHKCAELARLQLEHGAIGVTTATVAEAEAMAAAGSPTSWSRTRWSARPAIERLHRCGAPRARHGGRRRSHEPARRSPSARSAKRGRSSGSSSRSTSAWGAAARAAPRRPSTLGRARRTRRRRARGLLGLRGSLRERAGSRDARAARRAPAWSACSRSRTGSAPTGCRSGPCPPEPPGRTPITGSMPRDHRGAGRDVRPDGPLPRAARSRGSRSPSPSRPRRSAFTATSSCSTRAARRSVATSGRPRGRTAGASSRSSTRSTSASASPAVRRTGSAIARRSIPTYAPTTVNLFGAFHVVEAGQIVDVWPVLARHGDT